MVLFAVLRTCPAVPTAPAAFVAAATGTATSGAATLTAVRAAVVAADLAALLAPEWAAPPPPPVPASPTGCVRDALDDRGLNKSTPGVGLLSDPLPESGPSEPAASLPARRRSLTPRTAARAVSSRTAPVPACHAPLTWRPIVPMLLAGYTVALAATLWSSEEYVALAWDSAGVTTGPVTVPLVLALGLGLGQAVGAAEGFGILAMASLGPIVSVLLVGFWIRRSAALAAREQG